MALESLQAEVFIPSLGDVLSHSVMSDSLRPYGLQPARFLCPRGFPRQEYWSGLPCPPPGDLPDAGIKPVSPLSPSLAGGFFTPVPLGTPLRNPGAGKSVTLLNVSGKTHKSSWFYINLGDTTIIYI